MRRIRARITYANVVSSIALFLVVSGGAAVAANQLGKNSVGSNQLKANSVGTGKLKAGAVKGGKLANGAVTVNKIANSSVTTPKLADAAVDAPKLADSAVGSSKLTDSAVTAAKLAGAAVTAGKIADGAVGTAKLANGAVLATKLGPIVTRTVSGAVPKKEQGALTATCQAGEVLISGGADWTRLGPDLLLQIAESSKSGPNAWRVTGNNLSESAVTLNVHAYCLAP